MERAYYILGSNSTRPISKKTIFADGSADQSFRTDIDIELSHWLPNTTPSSFKADTSTEICLNFTEKGNLPDFDLVVNNHLDVDGVLSVFVLIHSRIASNHRDLLVECAEIGDFWGYGKNRAIALFQNLTYLIEDLRNQSLDIGEKYARCFELLLNVTAKPEILDDTYDKDYGIKSLGKSLDLLSENKIQRRQNNEHFVSYIVSKEVTKGNSDSYLKVPAFNAPLSTQNLFPPQVRNFRDSQKVQLVAVEDANGWFYDLHYPGYMWADTHKLWRAPGFNFQGSTNAYYYGHFPLDQAVSELKRREVNSGEWILARELTPFSSIKGRNFPVILSFIGVSGLPAISSLNPETVSDILAMAFDL